MFVFCGFDMDIVRLFLVGYDIVNYHTQIWEQENLELDQEIDGKTR
jgi:methionyl-tRNA synthetase